LIPAGWQYPGLGAARIVVDDVAYGTASKGNSASPMVAEIAIDGDRRGHLEVGYSEACPEFDEGPFLREERTLVNEIARQVGLIVKRRQAEEERCRLQDQLWHTERLATIGQLTAGVAHELNEPLGAVLGFAQLTKKCPRLPKQATHDVERIIQAALHAREVVKKLMTFGRQSPPHKMPVSLNRVVQEGLELVRPRCDHGGIELKCELAADLPTVTVDPSQLHQVLVNLVVNAAQAMPRGGMIAISTSASPDAATVCLSVQDTGTGMNEEVLKQIFVPFFTTKDVGQGTGLGLCVVQGIVTSHGGTIQVDSKLGRGTRFKVCLPPTIPTQ
jgi:C4-dicarboxylate-specific signal transduction histidine kinase